MSERTIPASQRQRAEARRQGHVPRSGNLTSAVVLLTLAVALLTVGDYLASTLAVLLKSALQTSLPLQVDRTLILDRIVAAATQALLVTGLFVSLLGVAALATDLVQAGFLLTLAPLQFQWSRLAPQENFSGRQLGRRLSGALGQAVKVALVAALVSWNLFRHQAVTRSDTSLLRLPERLGAALGESLLQVAILLLIVGCVDVLLVRHRHECRMRMTPEQAREEQRQSGGTSGQRRPR